MSLLPGRARSFIRGKMQESPLFRGWLLNRQFRVERALLKGRSVATSSNPSVLHFSVNKAATQYTKRIMIRCGEENGLVTVRMSDYAWEKNLPYLFTLSPEEVKPYLHVFRPRGYLYTVFGGLVEGIPDIQQYRTVIMVRDPRDVLVSGYYSYSKSHAVPKSEEKAQEFLALRERLNKMTVDEYVVEMTENARWRMEQYLDISRTGPAVCILKYEDMLADFPAWLDRLIAHCQWRISPALKDRLLSEADQGKRVKQEDTGKHRRQVTPGDHRRKLKDETVEYLNSHLSGILTAFGYR